MREKERNEKTKILKEIVCRNKLKNSGTNIDKMVEFLIQQGIEARYVYRDEV